VDPKNPQTSGPTNGLPNIWKLKMPGIDIFKEKSSDALSPSQWRAYFPDPGKVFLVRINGLLFLKYFDVAIIYI